MEKTADPSASGRPAVSDEASERPFAAWRVALPAFLFTRGCLFVFAWLLNHFGPAHLRSGSFLLHGGTHHQHWLVDAFQRWDAFWFIHIVREGYQYHGIVEQVSGVTAGLPETNITPFPLYPLTMKGLDWLFGDPAIAGLVVSNLCLLLALWVLYKLVRLDHDHDVGVATVWLFAAVPWTYAFSAIYAESLFFLLLIGSVWAIRKERYLLSGLLGALCAVTRLPGLFVIVPLAIEHLRRHGLRLSGGGVRGLWLLLVPVGVAAYFAYLYDLTGEPFAYFVAQRGWHKEFVPFWTHPLSWLRADSLSPENYLNLATTVFVVAVLVAGFRRIRLSYWVYGVVGFAMTLSSSYLLGLPRYAAALFPLFMIIATFRGRALWLRQGVLVAFAMGAPMAFWAWHSWKYAF